MAYDDDEDDNNDHDDDNDDDDDDVDDDDDDANDNDDDNGMVCNVTRKVGSASVPTIPPPGSSQFTVSSSKYSYFP